MDSLEKSAIDGVVLTKLRQIEDDRGAVMHMLRSDAADFKAFGECYFSEILPGKVKGWKRHKTQIQNIAVPIGHARFVIYDDRTASQTKEKIQIVDLKRPDKYFRLTIPAGLWYSFACLGDKPALLANCANTPHDPSESEQIAVDRFCVSYNWKD
ncbi:MAG: dTDP-4-dehydrorhamnose 3,5-epimerase family protein [Coxiellaceae bacterium]|nr:dTDP-4-dehydrorhamnose 3,5-epimerase family protein [Coxiellaceae bacterium]